ncbi:MAG: peptidase [Firmicutes bacterium]|nr:peptidase [Bacillota bacterium]
MPFWAYLVGIPCFGLLILVHEAGHYLAARWNGIAVAEFAIGWGPRIWGFEAGGTVWNLRAIPLGGYVRWHEEGAQAFAQAPVRARFWALVSGPLANLLLTWLALLVLFGPVLGWGWAAVPMSLKIIGMQTSEWLTAIGGLFHGAGVNLQGPVGIAHMAAQQAALGPEQLLFFASFLSLNLALFNLLPFPALDGGRLCFLGLERIRRQALDPHVEGWIHAGGFLLMMLLALATTVKDLLA